MGCFHMKYFLRGKLIAINVVDILPSIMCSKYFFYDFVLKNYNLAKFSAMIDIEYIRWMQQSFPEFKYYSLDYYIQGYEKLSYKSNFFVIEVSLNHLKFFALEQIYGWSLLLKFESKLT